MGRILGQLTGLKEDFQEPETGIGTHMSFLLTFAWLHSVGRLLPISGKMATGGWRVH